MKSSKIIENIIEGLAAVSNDDNAVAINNAIMIIREMSTSNRSLAEAYEDVATRLRTRAINDITAKPTKVTLVMGYHSNKEEDEDGWSPVKAFFNHDNANKFMEDIDTGVISLHDLFPYTFKDGDKKVESVDVDIE